MPRELAVKSPSVKDIAAAAKKLNFEPEVEVDAAHPSRWWKQEGRVLVKQVGSKTEILHDIANELNKKQ